jgi:geranylgeranyl reductase family protein
MRAIVVGAGPAGAAAAIELARAGTDVVLLDRCAWPRPKTCGDGISPLGIREGAALGVRIEGAVRLGDALVTTPRGTSFIGGWPSPTPWGTTVERDELDALLVTRAMEVGVRFLPATSVRSLAVATNGVTASVTDGAGESSVTADVVVLAEGASGGLAAKAGFPPHRSRLVAVRGYAQARSPLPARYGLFYDRFLTPGYGWIFPVDEFRANVGVCVDPRVLAREHGDARALLGRWLAQGAAPRSILGVGAPLEDVRGGIIPSGRRRRAKPRVYLVGDAAGVADPFTAEGIFQAMQSGRLAARALTDAPNLAQAARRYERALRELDRNERTARRLRATFNLTIEPYARHAAARRAYADALMTDVFFPKHSFAGFVWNLTRRW